MKRKILVFAVLFLALFSMISMAFATVPVKMIKGDHYGGQGHISCKYSSWPVTYYGPVNVVVNEETDEIMARGRRVTSYNLGYGASHDWEFSVYGHVTKTCTGIGFITYYFSFDEHYHKNQLRGSGTGLFTINFATQPPDLAISLTEG